jgi:hypothetical protein
MELIRFVKVAAILAALFVFANPVVAGKIGFSQNLVYPIAVAGWCT